MKTAQQQECHETIRSRAVRGHTHTCTGKHGPKDTHYCGECGRRWWT